LKEMMRHMRSTVQEGGFVKANNAEKIFREQLDDQYSTEANKRGGFGISEMIYQQLTEKFGAQLGLKNKPLQPQGPIAPDKKIQIEELSKSPREISYLVQPDKDNTEKNVAIQNPWAGVLQNKNRLEGDKTSYSIKHDNGLESLILTQGAPSSETRHLSVGDQIQAGQSLGLASSVSPLVWTVKNSVSE
jgi:peptidoglycan hydrolase FlgJ